MCQPWRATDKIGVAAYLPTPNQPMIGTIDDEGKVVAVGDGPSSPKARRDSLTALIGAGPLASTAIDGAKDVEEAMQTT